MLTAAECKMAAERARTYPAGHGFKYFAVDLTLDDLKAMNLPSSVVVDDAIPLGGASLAGWLAVNKPEFVKEYGWPAVAVAAVRGKIDNRALSSAVHSICVTLSIGQEEYCRTLNDNPSDIARDLEGAYARLEKEEAESADRSRMQSGG